MSYIVRIIIGIGNIFIDVFTFFKNQNLLFEVIKILLVNCYFYYLKKYC